MCALLCKLVTGITAPSPPRNDECVAVHKTSGISNAPRETSPLWGAKRVLRGKFGCVLAAYRMSAELGGRYAEGSEMVHQLTVGALWVHPSWVLETGIIQDLNGPDTTSFLLGIRKHF